MLWCQNVANPNPAPNRISTYTGVYEHFGLLHERSYFAHGIHCSEEERDMLLDNKVWNGGGGYCCIFRFQ